MQDINNQAQVKGYVRQESDGQDELEFFRLRPAEQMFVVSLVHRDQERGHTDA